jgi:hypothetical protein
VRSKSISANYGSGTSVGVRFTDTLVALTTKESDSSGRISGGYWK